MSLVDTQSFLPAAHRVRTSQTELAALIARMNPQDGVTEPLEGLHFRRFSSPTEIGHGVAYPALCVVALGSKEVLLGENRYVYDPDHYLIVTAVLPIASRVIDASPDHPFLSVLISLDPALVGSVIVDAGQPAPPGQASVRAIDVSAVDADLLEAVVRLVKLVEAPEDVRILRPLITREIVYRLLAGKQGSRVRYIAAMNGTPHRMAKAIDRVRHDFAGHLQLEAIAQELGMSLSTLHHQFKAVTAMSPLEFQKHLRLQEARRLMIGEGVDVAGAGYAVGYHNSSHFIREYKRLFGASPRRDIDRGREAGSRGADRQRS